MIAFGGVIAAFDKRYRKVAANVKTTGPLSEQKLSEQDEPATSAGAGLAVDLALATTPESVTNKGDA